MIVPTRLATCYQGYGSTPVEVECMGGAGSYCHGNSLGELVSLALPTVQSDEGVWCRAHSVGSPSTERHWRCGCGLWYGGNHTGSWK